MAKDSAAELYLLVRLEGSPREEESFLVVNGTHLALRLFSEPNNDGIDCPDYACVSYIWGPRSVQNPANYGPAQISSNTIPSLVAAMRNCEHKAFWIDAFCVPTAQPARGTTLESMGFIYSQAVDVRVALSAQSFTAVVQLSLGDCLDDEALKTLDDDTWIQSVWTYQEVVNSQRMTFVCPDATESTVDGSDFLSRLGYSLVKYKNRHGLDPLAMQEKFPSLDAMENLIADWGTAAYTERSALAVMSNLDRRVWNNERNYFYSMIGSVTSTPSKRSETEEIHLSEVFMRICEEKEDFSFIYSSSARSKDPARGWRPANGTLPSILPWHCWGDSQPGYFDAEGKLWLEEMLEFQSCSISRAAREHIARWLQQDDLAQREVVELAKLAYTALRRIGFTGCDEYLTLRDGLWFPQIALRQATEIEVLVSTTIRWALGAPGVARIVQPGLVEYIPGVFFGLVDRRDLEDFYSIFGDPRDDVAEPPAGAEEVGDGTSNQLMISSEWQSRRT